MRGKEIKCEKCDEKILKQDDLEQHNQNCHGELSSPNSKRMKMKNRNDRKEDDEYDMMEIDDPLEMSKKQDQKVELLQKRFDKEHEQMKESKRKNDMIEEGNKKKLKKQKSKKKNKKENSVKNKSKVIPAKYENIFEEVGIKIEEFCIFPVKGDGACGANSTALHCHRSQNLGPYVMRNVNEFIAKFWPFFQDFFQFPVTVKVGLKTEQFENETMFLEFLKSDNRSGYMWMDHHGWQAVSNMYQISIHILTTGIMNMEEPKARWTHILPDTRLSRFSTIHKGLPDMWLIHTDETHFDLLVHKDSELGREGSIEDLEKEKDDKIGEIKENTENGKVSSKGNIKNIKCEKCEKTFIKQVDLVQHTQKNHKDMVHMGPGYMGWEANDEVESDSGVKELKKTMVELIESHADMKKEVKKQKEELKELKDEYKTVLNMLKAETYARTKAETYAKVLQETLDAKNELEKQSVVEESNMEVDEEDDDGGKWQKQRSEKRKLRKRNRQNEAGVRCEKCGDTFQSRATLESHEKEHVGYICQKCERNFTNEKEFNQHEIDHEEKQYNCEHCDEAFQQEETLKNHFKLHESPEVIDGKECENTWVKRKELKEHVKKHERGEVLVCSHCDHRNTSKGALEEHLISHEKPKSKDKLQCCKCEKSYEDMRKLRRHDWRCHRTIECSICGDILRSRQDIRQHRADKHNMFYNRACKFFPDCFDEDECLFEHKDPKQSTCPMGDNCDNQECSFNEKEHKSLNRISCRFQEKCNRLGCQFKHNVLRQSFLEVRSTRNLKS